MSMAINDTAPTNESTASNMAHTSTSTKSDFTVKAGLAQMLKGGVIMDVVNAEQVSSNSPSPGPSCSKSVSTA